MTTLTKPFFLPEMITGVNSPTALKELLDLHAGPLTRENVNNSIPVIVLVSYIRMQDIVQRYNVLDAGFQITFKSWEELTYWSQQVTDVTGKIASLAAESVAGTQIFMVAQKEKLDIEAANKVLQAVFTALNEYEFNIRDMSWEGYVNSHQRLNELVQKNEYDPAAVIQELTRISKELEAYGQSIYWAALRARIPAALQRFVDLNTQSPHPVTLLDLVNLVRRNKAKNPLISGELLNEVGNLENLLATLISLFNGGINAIYKSVALQEEMMEAISIYQMLLNRLFSAGKDS